MSETPPHAASPGPPTASPPPSAAPSPKRKRLPWWLRFPFFLLLLALLSIGILAAGWWALEPLGQWRPRREKVERMVTIPRGASLEKIARTLQEQGLVPHWSLFAAYAVRHGMARRLEAGVFLLHTQMSLAELCDALSRVAAAQKSVTIPEGFTLAETAQRLVSAGAIPAAEEFLRLAAEPDMTRLAGSENGSVEGFLFPDTYFFTSDDDARSIMLRMIRTFDLRARDALSSPTLCLGRPLSRRELVALASMIQREARNNGEMANISSVYYNRMAKGIKLQCDATVRYALGMWDHALTLEDLKIDSPYNTYRYEGLPPGPICNPGLESLAAAAHPAQTDYLFYVYRGDGGHEFTKTYEEHEAAVHEFIKPVLRAKEIKTKPKK
ncbi:MAG: endolytic transglycosylase MltG [Candidatus Sumerlaeota bacterium]|nr:endolytic transglycosylase MltG [Candidatus Sumerlaeota bacterium]